MRKKLNSLEIFELSSWAMEASSFAVAGSSCSWRWRMRSVQSTKRESAAFASARSLGICRILVVGMKVVRCSSEACSDRKCCMSGMLVSARSCLVHRCWGSWNSAGKVSCSGNLCCHLTKLDCPNDASCHSACLQMVHPCPFSFPFHLRFSCHGLRPCDACFLIHLS